jgi:hypothetical protein
MLILALAASASLGLASSALAANVVTRVSGRVEIGHGEPPAWRAARIGDEVGANDRVRTGADGRVEVEMEAGTMRVHENSMLRLPPATKNGQRVDLERGRSLFDVIRRATRHFEVHTPTVVVSVKGTRFGVDTQQDVGEVAVYRGVVGVREAGIEDAIETLVREGFLATGGSGMPIELDVTPDGDPWASWADLRRESRELTPQPTRLNDVDRAKASLHRATNADVLRNAAERRPEVAERLRQIKQRREGPGEAKDRPGRKPADHAVPPVPAAPKLDGVRERDPSMRGLMEEDRGGSDAPLRSVLDTEKSAMLLSSDRFLDASLYTGGDVFTSGETRLLYENLDGLESDDLLIVMDSLKDLETTYESSGTTVTSSTFEADLTSALLANGMDPTMTTSVVTRLTGN